MIEGEWERVKEKTSVCHGGVERNKETERESVCVCVKGVAETGCHTFNCNATVLIHT